MFVLGLLCQLYSLDAALAREQIARIFGKKDVPRSCQPTWRCAKPARPGATPTWACVPHPGAACGGAADRRQRQHRAGAGRHGLGHGHLRHVPHHAGHVGVALPQRGVRKRRRPRAPGRRRDRRLCLCHRRQLRRQVRGDHHLGPRFFAQAGSHGSGGDGRDSARGGERAAWRPQHRPAHQGGTGRPADRHVRQPRRRAQGGAGAVRHRGLLLFGDHRTQDRRDLWHGGGGAVRRQPVHRAAALPAAPIQHRLAGAAGGPDTGARGVPSPTTGTR
jgi:hypothetical protein